MKAIQHISLTLRLALATVLLIALPASAQQQKNASFPAGKGAIMAEDIIVERITTDNVDRMEVSLNYLFDSLDVKANTFLAISPMLKSLDGSDSTLLRPIVVLGNRQRIMYNREGKLTPGYANAEVIDIDKLADKAKLYADATPFKPWMERARLYFAVDLCGCCELKDEDIHGPFWRMPRNPVQYMRYALPPVTHTEKTYDLSGSAYINFVVNKTDVRPDYMQNLRELAKITDTLDIMVADPNVTVKSIQIHGYASPEGSYANNVRLSTGRAQALTDYIRSLYSLPAEAFLPAEATPENWGDLRRVVESDSTLNNRQAILDIITAATNAIRLGEGNEVDRIEKTMARRHSKDYQHLLRDVYPWLRRSDYRVEFTVRSFVADEAKEIIKKNPAYLGADELANLVALYPVGSADYNNVFAVADKNIEALKEEKNRQRAYLVMAVAALKRGDTDTAKPYLDAAGSLPEADNARGAYHAILGDYTAAQTLLSTASAAGIPAATDNINFINEEQKAEP